MKPAGIAGEGGLNREGQEPGGSLPAPLPSLGGCWPGSLHSPGDPLGEEEGFGEATGGKIGESRNAPVSTCLLAVGSVPLLRLDVPFLGCLQGCLQSQALCLGPLAGITKGRS